MIPKRSVHGRRRRACCGALAALFLAACASAPPPADLPVVGEAWASQRSRGDNVDSVAVWGERAWVLATAKEGHRLLVLDAADGTLVRTVGGAGSGPGELLRPNGVAVVRNLALVVERDNARVQAFRLPGFEPLGSFGEQALRKPYGIAVIDRGEDGLAVWVTDDFDLPAPPDRGPDLLAERVRRFRVADLGDRVSAELVQSFGETVGPGALWVVESVAADSELDRLLLADEHEARLDLKVYDLDGGFTGTTVGRGTFVAQPEGIALWPCGAGGVWVTTDQRRPVTVFHLFDRGDLRLLGSFRGRSTGNTDGITVFAGPLGPWRHGLLVAVDDDGAVTAFDLGTLARRLGIDRCAGG